MMARYHWKRNKKVLLADQLKVAPPVSCQSQKRPAGSHRLKELDAQQLSGIWINHDSSTTWNQELFWLESPWPSSKYLMRSRRKSLKVLSLLDSLKVEPVSLFVVCCFFVSCAKEHKSSYIDWRTPKTECQIRTVKGNTPVLAPVRPIPKLAIVKKNMELIHNNW